MTDQYVFLCSSTPTLTEMENYGVLCQSTVYADSSSAMDWLLCEMRNIAKMDEQAGVDSKFFIGHETSMPIGQADVEEEWWLECTTGPLAFEVRVLKKKVY